MTQVNPVLYQTYMNGTMINPLNLIMDVEIRQAFGQHDLVFIRIEYGPSYPAVKQVIPYAAGTSVQMLWGRQPDVNNWYGYVNHHEYNSDADSGTGAQQITYVCIGTSRSLNTAKNRRWKEVTPTYIAKTIAAENGFRAVLTSVDWVLPYEIQASESDFTFLNRIADKTGMRFWCSGGTLYMLGTNVALYGANSISVPNYQYDKFIYQQDTLRNIEHFQGDNLPGTVISNRKVYGLDHADNRIFLSQDQQDSSVDYLNDFRPVSSYGEGQKMMRAWQDLSQNWIGAKVELFGNTLLYPGKLVNFQGRALMDGLAGYWIVTSAKHLLKAQGVSYSVLDRFITECQVMRNTAGSALSLKGTSPVIPEQVTSSLTGSGWSSDNKSVLYDGIPR